MDLSRISMTLMIGPEIPVPAPQFVTEALEAVRVSHNDHGPSGFKLEFKADRTSKYLPDYQLLLSRVVSAGNRVVVMVNLGSAPRVLMDGIISHLELSHSKQAGGSTISVTGEDISLKMDLTEKTQGKPGMGHFEIVDTILAGYARYGVIPMVIPTSTNLASNPLENVPQQYATDRAYINQLAQLHGNVFLVRPGPAPLTNIAYWGPPPRVGVPSPTLTVDMGQGTNVESINFTFDGLAPTLFQGVDQDRDSEQDVPIATETSLRLPLAAESALLFERSLARTQIVNTPQGAVDTLAYVQGLTDKSTDNVVTGQGQVDTLRYGAIMDVPGLVAVRGCGISFDGLYYVGSVTHELRRGQYNQQFTLSREGLVSTLPVVPP